MRERTHFSSCNDSANTGIAWRNGWIDRFDLSKFLIGVNVLLDYSLLTIGEFHAIALHIPARETLELLVGRFQNIYVIDRSKNSKNNLHKPA